MVYLIADLDKIKISDHIVNFNSIESLWKKFKASTPISCLRALAVLYTMVRDTYKDKFIIEKAKNIEQNIDAYFTLTAAFLSKGFRVETLANGTDGMFDALKLVKKEATQVEGQIIPTTSVMREAGIGFYLLRASDPAYSEFMSNSCTLFDIGFSPLFAKYCDISLLKKVKGPRAFMLIDDVDGKGKKVNFSDLTETHLDSITKRKYYKKIIDITKKVNSKETFIKALQAISVEISKDDRVVVKAFKPVDKSKLPLVF